MSEPSPTPEERAAAAPRQLFNRDFVLLWQGQLVSQLGNQAFFVAMMFWTMQATGSASVMGLLLMLSSLPGIFLAPMGGTFADRHSRRTVIVVSDLVRGVAVLGVAGLMLWRPGATEVILAGLFANAVLGGVVGAVFLPAITAAIPDLVPRRRVAAANSLSQLSNQGSVFLGQAAGGVLFRLLGTPLLFLVDGLSYLVSAISESFIRIPQELPETTRGLKEVFSGYLRDTREGLAWVWRRPGMRDFLFAATAVNFFAMPVFVLLPFYVERSLSAGADWYGFLLAALSAGNIGGYLLAGALKLSGRARSATLIGFLFGVAAAISLAGLVSHRGLALGIFGAMGVCTGSINIFVLTLFQVTTPGEMRGRVMGLVIAISGAATPLGMGLAGLVGDLTGKDVPLLWGLGGLAIALVTLAAAARRPFREFLAQEIGEEEAVPGQVAEAPSAEVPPES